MDRDLSLGTPSGIRDWSVGSAPGKRIVENQLAALFGSWGYEEVITGTIEYEAVFSQSLNEEEKNQLYRFFGREGESLTLRPDMTTPIARFVASQMADAPTPLRLFYTANVFRHEKPQAGRYREFYQAGIELIGTDTGRADAEVIMLASQALATLGVEDFKIGVGQVQLLDCLLESISLSREHLNRLKQAIANKDYVAVNQITEQSGVSPKERELLKSLPLVQSPGKFFSTLEKFGFSDTIAREVDRLEEVFEALAAAGLQENVFVDLGITRDFEYYTGIVFEAYTHALGFPICGGGRYNNLFSRFGMDCPATGFALGIERILLVLEKLGKLPRKKNKEILVYGRDFRSILRSAAELRSQGHSVEIDIHGRSLKELEDYAGKTGMKLFEAAGGEE